MKPRLVGTILLLTVALSLSACTKVKQPIVNVPEGISEQEVRAWYEATGYLREIAKNNRLVTEAVIDLRAHGVLDGGESYHAMLTAFGKIAQLEIQASDYLENWHNQFGEEQSPRFLFFIDEILKQVQEATDNGLVGIKNEVAQGHVAMFLETIRAALGYARILAGVDIAYGAGAAPRLIFSVGNGEVELCLG